MLAWCCFNCHLWTLKWWIYWKEAKLDLNTWCPHSSADQAPMSFYLVRLISKTPCMVLRLGFPIGTPAHTRNKVSRVCRTTCISPLTAYCACVYFVANTFLTDCRWAAWRDPQTSLSSSCSEQRDNPEDQEKSCGSAVTVQMSIRPCCQISTVG